MSVLMLTMLLACFRRWCGLQEHIFLLIFWELVHSREDGRRRTRKCVLRGTSNISIEQKCQTLFPATRHMFPAILKMTHIGGDLSAGRGLQTTDFYVGGVRGF